MSGLAPDSWAAILQAGNSVCTRHIQQDHVCPVICQVAPGTDIFSRVQKLPFDRILGNPLQELQEAPIILYADINAQSFGDIYMSMAHKAKEGSINYRVRYRPSTASSDQHLTVA